MSGGGSRRPAPGRGSGVSGAGRGAGGGLVAGNMFTPGSAGGQSVLVWEGPAALRTAGAQVGAGQWCDKVAPVVVSYHTGKTSSVPPQEMTRQLDGQFTALSLMSAKEILAGMATFDERKRSPVSHTAIRQTFQKKLTENLRDRHHFPPEVAGSLASRAMKELAVLHNPDQLLSGPQGPSLVGGVVALGDRVTNSAVGAQTAQGPRDLIRAAAQAAVDAGQGDRLLRMRVVLTDSPDLAKDLNRGLEALEPRSLAEREAVSPRGPPPTPQVLSDRLAQLPGGPDGLEDLTRDELRQALTQPPGQTPDQPHTPTPDSLDTPTPDGLDHAAGLDDEPLPGDTAPQTGAPGLDKPGLDGGVPEMGAPDRGAPGAPVSAPHAPAPVEPVARPTDSLPSMSAPTPDLNAPDRSAREQNAPDRAASDRSAPEQNRPDRVPEARAGRAWSQCPERGCTRWGRAGFAWSGCPERGCTRWGCTGFAYPGACGRADHTAFCAAGVCGATGPLAAGCLAHDPQATNPTGPTGPAEPAGQAGPAEWSAGQAGPVGPAGSVWSVWCAGSGCCWGGHLRCPGGYCPA